MYFKLHVALCCVLGLKEMSINLIANIQAENYCKPGVEINVFSSLFGCILFILQSLIMLSQQIFSFYHFYFCHYFFLFHVINIIDDQQLTTDSNFICEQCNFTVNVIKNVSLFNKEFSLLHH